MQPHLYTPTKRIEANRRNGKLGGVKTPEGKAIVRKNAIKHGILSNFVLDDEEEVLLRQLEQSLIKEYEPVGTLEHFLVLRVAFCMLRLRRCSKMESEYLVQAPESQAYIPTEDELCE